MSRDEPAGALRLTLEDLGEPHELRGRCPACRARITVRVDPGLRKAQAKIRRYKLWDLEWETGTVDLDMAEGPRRFYCLCGRVLEAGVEMVVKS
ncbi:MAG: hypothetical protein HY558_02760 [Euryarchaeota archaeon]|nr:hypothetical protein [Euryarchaeota archaeon]